MDFTTDALRVVVARLLLVVVIFGIVWLLRAALAWILSRPLRAVLLRARFGSAEELNEVIRSIVFVPVRCVLLALAIDLSARVLELSPTLMTFSLNLARSLVIVAVAIFIFRLTNALLLSQQRVRLLTAVAIDDALLPFIRTGITLVVIAIMLVIVLQVWGYDVTGLVAGLGLGGLAFSLAAQDLLSNLFGFAAIVSDRPFVVGEYVKTPDVEGSIERVGIRSTRIRQANQAVVYVPNSKLAAGTILNWSRLAKRQIDFTLTINYAVRSEQLEKLLVAIREVVSSRPTVEQGSVVVYLISFSTNSFSILVRCYLTLPDWTAFTAEKELILLQIMHQMERIGIVPPPPIPLAPVPAGTVAVIAPAQKDQSAAPPDKPT